MPEREEKSCDCDLVLDTVVELEDLLDDGECQRLIDAACARAAKVGWAEVKHANYATQDVKVWKLGSREAIRIFEDRVAGPMKQAIATHFRLPLAVVDLDDAFVVRYAVGAQTSLQFHRDGSVVSGIVSLSASTDYDGGGTVFRNGTLFRPEKGCGILFGGQRLHSGGTVTRGMRFICTLFFKCGKLDCRDLAVAKDAEVDKEQMWGEVKNLFGFGG